MVTLETKVIRIRMKTLRKLMKQFPAYPRETMANYFDRVEQIIRGIDIQ